MEKNSLSRKQCWENWISTSKGKRLDPYLTPYTKLTQNATLTLNSWTIKLLQENTEINMHGLRFGNGFLNTTPKAQATKEKEKKILNKNQLRFIKKK